MRTANVAAIVLAALCLGSLLAQTTITPQITEAAPSTTPSDAHRFRQVITVQTVLDRHNLSGGRIDGMIGSRTRAAIEVWQARHSLPPTGALDSDTRASILQFATNVLALRLVTTNDHAELSVVPRTWSEKSAMARLGYETILEMLAESSHASENALIMLNPSVAWPDPPPGTEVVVPNPFPSAQVRAERVAISLSGKWIRVYDSSGDVVAHFPCSIAADKSKRPAGELRVSVAASEPNYTFNPEVFPEDPESSALQGRKLIIPQGPNNPVGMAWVGLNLPGYGMHGTPHPGDIGKTESHGCFRLTNWNAAKLLRMVRLDMPVTVEE